MEDGLEKSFHWGRVHMQSFEMKWTSPGSREQSVTPHIFRGISQALLPHAKEVENRTNELTTVHDLTKEDEEMASGNQSANFYSLRLKKIL